VRPHDGLMAAHLILSDLTASRSHRFAYPSGFRPLIYAAICLRRRVRCRIPKLQMDHFKAPHFAGKL
jgi:hypothetical protein